MKIELIQLQRHGDHRGGLVALEENENVPFSVKRVYYLFDTRAGVRRGLHAHRSLNQLAIAVRGSCQFILDDGEERVELTLDNPAQGLLIRPGVWREMYAFSEDCVLMVLADQLYDADDYIRDYAEFLTMTQTVGQ
jgi:dTDP-4-dehydrorhamnose 3,5-epimerase-like enzyme